MKCQPARTVAMNTFVMCEIFYLYNVRRMGRAGSGGSSLIDLRRALMASDLVLVFQAACTYLPSMQQLFGTTPLAVEPAFSTWPPIAGGLIQINTTAPTMVWHR